MVRSCVGEYGLGRGGVRGSAAVTQGAYPGALTDPADRLGCSPAVRLAQRGARPMSDESTKTEVDEFLEIRKPGAHLDEGVVADDFVLMLGVDLVNFPKFPRVDDAVTYPK